jgi:hypothetical protein
MIWVCPGSRRTTDPATRIPHRHLPPATHGTIGGAGCGADQKTTISGEVRR